MRMNRLGIVFSILILSLSLASAVSLSDYVVSPTDPLVNQEISINATFVGTNEAERWVNWTKQGISQGWLIPPLISKWDFKEPWFNASSVFDVALMLQVFLMLPGLGTIMELLLIFQFRLRFIQ